MSPFPIRTSSKEFNQFELFAPHATDFYKTGHISQYDPGTELVAANVTPRSNRYISAHLGVKVDKYVSWGSQIAVKQLIGYWNRFFAMDKEKAIAKYRRRVETALQRPVPYEQFAALHDLGYLPVHVVRLPEGMCFDFRTPMVLLWNTLPSFFWVTNYIETQLSAEIWKPATTAVIALEYRATSEYWATLTSDEAWFTDWQNHDFSARGMGPGVDGAISGTGHLLFSNGTDTISAIDAVEHFYIDGDQVVAGSVPATEHSVMCMGLKDGEFETFKRLITETYPDGIVSIVSDTWDLWKVLTDYLPRLKNEIMARNGKVVIRPDSGDPVLILCGDPSAPIDSPQNKGVIRLLAEVFGTTVNSKGFHQVDSHVGAIYGDSITLDRATQIFQRLYDVKFASTNVVFGVGSFSYQYNTRDTLGIAMKATYGVVDGDERFLLKDPITDDGTKKSATGMIQVVREFVTGDIKVIDGLSMDEWNDYNDGVYAQVESLWEPLYVDGSFFEGSWVTAKDHAMRAVKTHVARKFVATGYEG